MVINIDTHIAGTGSTIPVSSPSPPPLSLPSPHSPPASPRSKPCRGFVEHAGVWWGGLSGSGRAGGAGGGFWGSS